MSVAIEPPRTEATDAGVIEEARARQRCQRALVGGAALAGALAVVLLIVLAGGGGVGRGVPSSRAGSQPAARPAHPAVVNVGSSTVLTGAFMGVPCHDPGSSTCDRVGLTVWLRHPAMTVTMTIDGRPLRPLQVASRGRPRTEFIGYLQPVGLVDSSHLSAGPGPVRWTSEYAPLPHVQLRIYGRNGRVLTTHLDVYLSAGWG